VTAYDDARELIRQGKEALADPSKARYHARLDAVIKNLEWCIEEDRTFFEQLAAVAAVTDVANERWDES
jgi:hypothetical protein